MSDNDVQSIKGEINTLRAVVDERWISHDKRSDERWTDLMEQFHSMEKRMDGRPCTEHVKLMSEFNARLRENENKVSGISNKLWAVLAMVIGALVTAVVGILHKQ